MYHAYGQAFYLPQSLMTAVEDCLRLPTLQEVHMGTMQIPLSMLNRHANINCLSFSGCPQMPDCSDDAYLQLKSLTVWGIGDFYWCSFSTWAKRHITGLHSMKCDYSIEQMILEFLGICLGTLNNLYLKLQAPYTTTYYIDTGKVVNYLTPPKPLINLSSLPRLQHLTIRVDVYYDDGLEETDFPAYPEEYCKSCLPSAIQILKTASSLQHLTIEICVDDLGVTNTFSVSPPSN